MNNSTIRSIIAILGALVAVFVVSIAIDIILHTVGFYQGESLNDFQAAIASIYRVLTGVMGGYIAARLAPNDPMRHALILGVVGAIISSGGAILMGDKGPAWYSIGLILVSIPLSWIGGKIYIARK